MQKLKMHSPNLTQENVARIRELFPNCVTEARDEDGKVKLAVDFDLLRQELSESSDTVLTGRASVKPCSLPMRPLPKRCALAGKRVWTLTPPKICILRATTLMP